MKIPNWLYDILKWLCILGLPALSTFYSSLAVRWGWPNAEQIAWTISDINVFLGAIIGISSAGYALELRNQSKKEETNNVA